MFWYVASILASFGCDCDRAVFFFIFMPEMKGRSLEELDEMFQNHVPRKDFPKYQCVSSERAREIVMKQIGGERDQVVVHAENSA
jgi:hypothetical protein